MQNYIQKKAFTLLEVMVVVIIVGVLAALAGVNYFRVIERQKAEEGKHVLQMLLRAQKAYAIDNNTPATTIDVLDVTIPTLKYFNAPTINPPGGGIAAITRIGGIYTLTIFDGGGLECGNTNDGCAAAGISCSTCPAPTPP